MREAAVRPKAGVAPQVYRSQARPAVPRWKSTSSSEPVPWDSGEWIQATSQGLASSDNRKKFVTAFPDACADSLLRRPGGQPLAPLRSE